ncbi:hypothetical protein DDB_G0277593 [Dictyostelium discoideum AX4]|uniref:Uncharacterized protein n=1 Tax=Dictyostelium discoideum TaxID=44689 RepID=Q75JY9_DICDI|nr:hypothetical protein DDB_G0277593 [Dictyostelium discoideum AX4]EAL68614.1 hypothetical protein DDB_G0277593 [Dictyostelium discoideum AX4]|eukprot:XP_642535.1 hypothetical protein DDB_G0277593 [Dictyostelium discoideum AX4]
MTIIKSLTSISKISVNQKEKINTSNNDRLNFQTQNENSRWKIPSYIIYNVKYRLIAYC